MFLLHKIGMDQTRTKQVAILVETGRSYPRSILAGVRKFLAEKGPWATLVESFAPGEAMPQWLKSWNGDGILIQTYPSPSPESVLDSHIPKVELRSRRYHSLRPFVGCDNRKIGKLVAGHFLERGYENFAYTTRESQDFFLERSDNFRETVVGAGRACRELPNPEHGEFSDYDSYMESVISALDQTPKPVAVFATSDKLGTYVLDACRRGGISVPEEVAVVGCENDETLCEFSVPEMSSVNFDGERVGYEAASLLARLMAGEAPPLNPVLLPPLGIITRESSDDLAVRDRLVSQASRIFRERLSDGISVTDVANRLNCSRSTLERRMKAALGRSPKEELLRLRISRIEYLLIYSDFTLETIAEQVGFAQATHLHAVFRQQHGMTPGKFRDRKKPG